jgi:glutamyl-tRNA reductase
MLASVGLSFKTASAEIRGKFSFNNDDIYTFGTDLLKISGINGIVILSTCNRSEFYFEYDNSTNSNYLQIVLSKLLEFKGEDNSNIKYFYYKKEKETVNHLFSVMCGFDSLSLGEYQIVGQVKNAFKISEKYSFASKELNRLFQKAFETGKKVRTLTEINKGASSVSYASIELIQKTCRNIETKNIAVIGLGQTGEAVIEYLTKLKPKQLFISNRTFFKAQNLASRFNAIPVKLEELNIINNQAEIIFVASSSSVPLITKEDMSKTIGNKVLIDLSIPRNIAIDVDDLDNCRVFDIDDLQEIVSNNNKRRKGQVEHGMVIMQELESRFLNWLSSQKLNSTINTIHKHFHEINKKELKEYKKINKENIDSYGNHITNKYIRLLIKNIKEVSDNGKDKEAIKVLNKVFQLQENQDT